MLYWCKLLVAFRSTQTRNKRCEQNVDEWMINWQYIYSDHWEVNV